MSIARKLVLLMGMALAALALTASTATAEDTPVEVINEDTLADCSPCTVHAEGEATISATIGGIPISRCHDEFEGTINHNGTGEVTWAGTEHGAPGCTVDDCITAGEPHWPLLGATEEAGEVSLAARFCLRGSAQVDIHCNANVHITEEPPPALDHHYNLSLTNHPCAGGAFFVTGAWEVESDPHDEIEIVHLGA